MTKKFEYTFKRANGAIVTLRKCVTDKMEERNACKARYAANYFNDILRSKYGYHRSEVTVRNIKEIMK